MSPISIAMLARTGSFTICAGPLSETRNAQAPRSIAMKITGHKTESVYRRYAIVNEDDVAEGLGRLAGWLDGKAAN